MITHTCIKIIFVMYRSFQYLNILYKPKVHKTWLINDVFLCGSLLSDLGLAKVVFLGKLHVTHEIGVHSLELMLLFGRGLPCRVAMILPGLIMCGMILRFCHLER